MPQPACPAPAAPCVENPTAWMPPEPPPPAAPPEGEMPAPYRGTRDHHGRFLKGNPGGPGNPNSRRTAALRQAFASVVTADHMRQLAQVFLDKALQGDLQAAKFVASYCLGRPAPAVNPDRLDLEEFAMYTEEAAVGGQVMPAMNGMSAGLANFVVSSVRPVRMKQYLDTMEVSLRTGVVPDTVVPASDADAACQHPHAGPQQEAPAGQSSDPDMPGQDRNADPRAAAAADANRDNGGAAPSPTSGAAAQPGAAPSPIGDVGQAASPRPRSRRDRRRQAMPGWPTPEELDELRRRAGRSPNGDNGGDPADGRPRGS